MKIKLDARPGFVYLLPMPATRTALLTVTMETIIVDFLDGCQWPAQPTRVEAIAVEAGVTLLKELDRAESRWVCQVPAGSTLPIHVPSGRITVPAE